MNLKMHFSQTDAKMFRDICIKRIMEIDPNGTAALALSGGTDSITVLFSMLELGRKPTCYTFHMAGINSVDYIASKKICKDFGLKHVEVVVPSDLETMYHDIERVIPYCEHVKKTIIQCMVPWLYIYPEMQEKTIITGIGGDDLFCTQRKLKIQFANEGDLAIMSMRHCYTDDLRFSGANIQRFASAYGKRFIDFYNTEDIFGFMRGFSLGAINKPVDKYASIKAFSDYYKRGSYYRDQTDHSYQINSKLRECHELLLKSKYNTGCHKAIIGLYNDIARRVANGNG